MRYLIHRVIGVYFTLLFIYFAPVVSAQAPPNRKPLVEAIAARGYDLTTHAGSGCFTEQVAFELHQEDRRWGHLKKRPGQNQHNGHAVDAVLWIDSGQAVDIIGSSASPNAKPAWTVDIPRYTGDDFRTPTAGCVPHPGTPVPNPGTPPPPDHTAAIEAIKLQLLGLEQTIKALAEALMQHDRAIVDLRGQVADEQEARTTGDIAVREDVAREIDALPTPPTRCRVNVLGLFRLGCELE